MCAYGARGRLIPSRTAGSTAKFWALTGEDAPRAFPSGNDPVMKHPDVVERDLSAADRLALVLAHCLSTDNDATLLTEASVVVVLMPKVVRASESFGSATWMPNEITQPNQF